MNHLICIFTNININVKMRKTVEKLMWVVLTKLLVCFMLIIIEVKVCKDQELKQSDPNSSPQNQNGK